MPKTLSRILELFLPTLGLTGIIQLAIWDAGIFEGMTMIEIFSHPLHWFMLLAMIAYALGIIWLILRHDTSDDMKELKDKIDELITEIREDRESRNGKRT